MFSARRHELIRHLWRFGCVALVTLLHVGLACADGSAICGGAAFPLSTPLGPTPHIEITVNGAPNWFLLDYGATKGTLWTPTATTAPTRTAAIALPGVPTADFLLRFNAHAAAPGAPAGIFGTDVLSRLTVQFDADKAFVSALPCDADALAAASFRPIDQTGFFSFERAQTNPSRPNVPILFLRLGEKQAFAQIDTGYGDTPDSHSIDINQALFESLGSETALSSAGTIDIATCEGVETRPVFRTKAGPVSVTDDKGGVLATIAIYRLILKQANACGGIGSMREPAAQLGWSFLQTLGTVVFDPRAHRVWMRPQP